VSAELSSEDYESIHHAGRTLREQGWRQVFTLNEMLSAWASLVTEVEQGYDQMVDEYTNDLSCRDWLAQAWPMLTANVRAHRQDELDAIDERFKAVTIDDGGLQLGRFYAFNAKDGWWWRRLPAIRRGEFARDIGTDGTADGLMAVLAGRPSAVLLLEMVSHDHLAAAAASLDMRLEVSRDATVGVLRGLADGTLAPGDVQRWASFVRRGYTTSAVSPVRPLDIEYESSWEDCIAEAVSRLDEIGDSIDGDVTPEEVCELLQMLGAPDL
jgi:hypothetical protein